MKAHCVKKNTFTGIIENDEVYEKLKNGKTDWKDSVKDKIDQVTIPRSLFERLMKLDKAVDDACKKAREEECCGNCDSCDDTDCQNTPDEEETGYGDDITGKTED